MGPFLCDVKASDCFDVPGLGSTTLEVLGLLFVTMEMGPINNDWHTSAKKGDFYTVVPNTYTNSHHMQQLMNIQTQ
jgi:hypothetical protein